MNERDLLIERLLDFGIYKINDKQLFELPIVDLEQELKKSCKIKGMMVKMLGGIKKFSVAYN